MNKIDWQPLGSTGCISTKIGCVTMFCFISHTINNRLRWYAAVSLDEMKHTWRNGRLMCSMQKAKEDAVRMGHELLLDWNAALGAELAKFERKMK